MSRRDGATPAERINAIVRRSFPRLAFTRPRKQEPTNMACDPDALTTTERPAIARDHDSVREQCLITHRACEEAGVLVGRRSPAALVGALLTEMSAECALTLLEVAARTACAIVEDEKKPNT